MKRLIVTGDDFGIAEPANEAIVESHRRGILTGASLMVAGGARRHAVELARDCPSLRVGLHIVLVEGRPVLPARIIPDLVDAEGEFSTHLVRAGFRFFFRPGIRKQLEAEIRAQFEAFQETGLSLDHANAHNHMHVHPTILNLILKVGSEFGLRALRLPNEPALVSWRASRKGLVPKLMTRTFLLPWIKLMKSMLRRRGVCHNDYIFGMADTGAMAAGLVLRLIRQLPEGITELYFHPATGRCPEIDRAMPRYRHEDEFRALIHPDVCNAVSGPGFERIAFGNLVKSGSVGRPPGGGARPSGDPNL